VSPTGKTVLIDAGTPESARRLERKLKNLVAGPLDLLLLTHPHADHLGGMQRVLESIGVRIFMEPGFDHPSQLYADLLREVEARGVPLRIGQAGRNVDLGGGAVLRLLAPGRPFLTRTRSDANANSIVARLTYGSTAFYFAADSEEDTEAWILKSGAEVASQVYKVAHHGSRYSSSKKLVEKIAPEIAVVSVGAGNDYGHPTRAALDRIEAVGARVLRTDLDGDITITSDGTRLKVRTEKGGGADSTDLVLGDPIIDQPGPAVRPVQPTAKKAGRERKGGAGSSVAKKPSAGQQATKKPRAEQPAAVAPAPATSPSGYVASRNSSVFHLPGCHNAAKIKPANLLKYKTREAAIADGRRPARDCNP
jgi:competence protein ComEC